MSFVFSKTSRGGKEDKIDDRTSKSAEGSTCNKSNFEFDFNERLSVESTKYEDRLEVGDAKGQTINGCSRAVIPNE